MICPKCGTSNEDTYQFCMNCGASLAGSVTSGPKQEAPSGETDAQKIQPSGTFGYRSHRKDLLKDGITPADAEVTVRTYYCTHYHSRLLGMDAFGYLGISNKRVIFQAHGSSGAGQSVIQSEVPIADISGISSYKGTYFSVGHMILAFIVSFMASVLTSSIVTALGTILSVISQSADVLAVVSWSLAIITIILALGFAEDSIWKSICATISSVSFSIAGGGTLISSVSRSLSSLGQNQSGGGGGGFALLGFLFAFLTGLYALSCMFRYARRPTFSLAINSKGGASTPINISGASGIGIFDVSAGKALAAEPAEDSDKMLQELGAVILDIQMLGDLGIKKWKS